MNEDGRLDAPAFHRNCEPIWSVIGPHLATRNGDVLELGSGTGQHVAVYAQRTPQLTWWPSDLDPDSLEIIEAWRQDAALPNLRGVTRIDLSDPDWRFATLNPAGNPPAPEAFTAMLCANVIHIAPWPVAVGLFNGAGRQLAPGAPFFLYGPFKRGAHTAPSNAAFDASLRRRDAAWGVRDLADVVALAARNGLALEDTIAMPANNFIILFRRRNRQV